MISEEGCRGVDSRQAGMRDYVVLLMHFFVSNASLSRNCVA